MALELPLTNNKGKTKQQESGRTIELCKSLEGNLGSLLTVHGTSAPGWWIWGLLYPVAAASVSVRRPVRSRYLGT